MKACLRPLTTIITLALLAGGLLLPAHAQEAGPRYVIVANAANQTPPAEAKELVKQLFLKNRTQWPGNIEALPFDRPAGSPEQAAFYRQVLGLSESEVAQHWISLKQRTGATRPREISSDTMALKMVEKYAGAFVIVNREAAAAADQARIVILLEIAP